MRTHMKRKEVDDVLGGKEAWKNVDKTASTSCLSSITLTHTRLYAQTFIVAELCGLRPAGPSRTKNDEGSTRSFEAPVSASLVHPAKGHLDIRMLTPSATCPKCDHREGYYRQLQIRSADEPMTTF